MPTPSGLPKVGERVRYTWLDSQGNKEFRDGTVMERSGGAYWALKVRWDEPTWDGKYTKWMVDAPYFWGKGRTAYSGMLRLAPKAAAEKRSA